MGLGLLFVGLLLSIFLIGIPIALMGLLVLVSGIISKSTGFLDKYACNNCRKSFTIKEASRLAK
jgi:transposase-like protein